MSKAKELGKIYKMNRVEKDLCMQAVASAIGISKATISRIERGKSIPSLKVLSALNKFFGINVSYEGVVKEPDKPDAIKGWIEEGETPNRRFIHLLSDKVLHESDNAKRGKAVLHYYHNSDEYITFEESYEEIKQKIKESL